MYRIAKKRKRINHSPSRLMMTGKLELAKYQHKIY